MAMPFPVLQPPMYQRTPSLVPTDLLAAIEGWDPRWTTAVNNRPGVAGLPAGPLLPVGFSPLEGAGRMGQDGGVIGSGNIPFPGNTDFLRGSGHYMTGSRGAVGRRTLVEVNHNKAITKKLVSAAHYQQVLDCVSQHVHVFDEVNVATALHRLAKLQPPGPSGQSSPIVYADQFQQLVAAVSRLLHRFEAQAVSNTMWAFATLSYLPGNNLLDEIARHAVSIISTFRPQATSNTLWAFAKLGYCPSRTLLEAGAGQMLQDLSKSVPQDISNTLWAFAALRHHPGPELMVRAATQSILTIQRFKPQELANTLWSFATLEHDPSTQLLDAMAIQIVTKIQGFRPQAVSNSLWAYAKLGYNPGILLLDVASQKAAGMLHQYTSQELANTVWALGALEHYPGSAILDSAATQIARRMEQFSPQDTANSIWGFAQLNHQPSKELTQGVAFYTLRHWSQMKAGDAVRTLAAVALIGNCPVASWQLLLSNLSSLPLSGFSEADLHQIHQTYLLLKNKGTPTAALMSKKPISDQLLKESEKVWKASVRQKNWMSQLHHEVSQALWQMRIEHQNDCITPDGLHNAAIILTGTNIVVEVQDSAQFAANCCMPLGRSVAKRTLLEGSGYTVVEIPHFDWATCNTTEQQQGLLSELLSACSMAPPPAFTPVPSLSSAPLPLPQETRGGQIQGLVASPYSRDSSITSSAYSGAQSLARLPSSTSAFNLESLSRSLQ